MTDSSAEESPRTYVRTHYAHNTYIHTYIQELTEARKNEKKQPFNTTFTPTIVKRFREMVHKTMPLGVKPNHVIEDFMEAFIIDKLGNMNQLSLTQFFINRPEQVNISKEDVVISKSPPKPRIDYSKLPLEELQKLHNQFQDNPDRHWESMLCAFELKKRGVIR